MRECGSPRFKRANRPRLRNGLFALVAGNTEAAIAGPHFALTYQTAAAGGQTEMSDGCGRLAPGAIEKIAPCSSGPVGLLQELPFVCAVVVAVGSTVMIVIKLCKDLPE